MVGISAMLAGGVFSGGFLAFANGANDTFKGVATLVGTRTTTWKRALVLATVATFLGSMAALFLGAELVAKFSGKGLVPNELTAMPVFSMAVALGAASTVALATRIGLPVSTTHVAVGSLVGIGVVNRRAHWKMIGAIVLAWVATLPMAVGLAAAIAAVLSPA